MGSQEDALRARVSVTFNPIRDSYVRFGDGLVPRRWEATAEFEDSDLPTLSVVVAIEDGRPEIQELAFRRVPDSKPFNLTSLRTIPVRPLLEISLTQVLLTVDDIATDQSGRPSIAWSPVADPSAIEAAVDLSRRRRRKPNEQEQEAKEIDRRLKAGESVPAIESAMHISRATVYRRRKLGRGGDRGRSR